MRIVGLTTAIGTGAWLATATVPGFAQDAIYQLVTPANPTINYVYRLNTVTGELTACWYGTQNNTACAKPAAAPNGDAGEPTPAPGLYQLAVPPNPERSNVFRLNTRTGAVSTCWIEGSDEAGWKVTCAPAHP